MTIRKVILALRGFNNINSIAEKKAFWNSFINLQKKLPSNIKVKFILQYYKNEESKLYSFLFEPFLEFNSKTDNISFDSKEYKKYISFKRNKMNQLNHSLSESYFISSISSYLETNKNKFKFDQLILLNYSLKTLNESKTGFIYDNLLPQNKLYLSYTDYIDQGYSTNLIIIPKKFLKIFSTFNDFFLNSISKRNDFLKKYNIFGRPLTIKRKYIKEWFFIIKNFLKNFIIYFLKLIEDNILKFIDIPILRFILNKVKIIVDIPYLTKEISFVDDSINQGRFYLKNLLTIKPILKYFIYENNLRKETIFISNDDLENYFDSYIIGRKNFILVLTDDFSFNEKNFKFELHNLKLKPKFIIFVKKKKIFPYQYLKKSDQFLKEIYPKNNKGDFQNILFVLSKIKNENQFIYNPPILFLNSLCTFKSCTDISYLNALLQFFIWEDISYVSFINKKVRHKYSEFPELFYYSNNNKLILDKCIINFKLIKDSNYSLPLKINSEKYNDIFILNNQKKLFL